MTGVIGGRQGRDHPAGLGMTARECLMLLPPAIRGAWPGIPIGDIPLEGLRSATSIDRDLDDDKACAGLCRSALDANELSTSSVKGSRDN